MEHSEYYRANKTNLDKRNSTIEAIDKEMCAQLFKKDLILPNCKSHEEINFFATLRYNRRVVLINQCQELLNTHRCPVICHWVKAMIDIVRQVNQIDLPMAFHPILIDCLQNNKLNIIHAKCERTK